MVEEEKRRRKKKKKKEEEKRRRRKKKKKKVKNAIYLRMRSTLMSETDLRGNFHLTFKELRI
jgi:hypothetical protein